LNLFFECVLLAAGFVLGSFLNVCITRVPLEESIVRPPSHCRECGKPIRWWNNVPVLSFLLLRGQCRDCGSRIPYRYPAVELLTALVFAGCYAWFGPSWLTLKYSVFSFLLIGLIFMDAETGLLPHEFTYPGIALGLTFAWIAPGDPDGTRLILYVFHEQVTDPRLLSLLDSLIGAVVGAGFFYLAWALYYLARKRHGLGFGDIALMAMTGAFLGLKLNLFVIACAPLVTLIYVLLMQGWGAIRQNRDRQPLPARANAEHSHARVKESDDLPLLQREIPFGVFLGGCSLIAVFFGESAWTWYLGRF
jgi:leader peptidase (prepilin peptidase) / N-methyltransferase